MTPIPNWRVVLDGTDLTERLAPRLLDLSLSECRGGEADQLDIRLQDHDGRVQLPRRGVMLTVAIGWRGEALLEKGMFCVDEVEHSGSPDVITIRARSADLTSTLRMRRERSWHDTTLGAVLTVLAGENNLTPRVAQTLASIALPHLDQANESDMNLLTRLARRFDAVATIKAGALIFLPIGSSSTASGQTLPTVTLTRSDGDQHRYTVADRDSFSGVRAHWNDKKSAQRKAVLVGQDSNVKSLRETYDSEKTARENAEAEWKRIQRDAAKFSYTLALGRADLYPEQRVIVSGFKSDIDGQQWLIAKTTHTINGSSGFITALELEAAID